MAKAPSGFGSIRKKVVNGKTYYEGRYTDPILHKQKSVSAPTQKECREKLMKVLSQIEQGAYVTPNKLRVKDWAVQWLRDKLDIKEGTRVLYQSALDTHIIPELGNIMLKDLRPVHCQEFVRVIARKTTPKTGQPISAKTVKNIIGILHRMLDDAKRLELILSNPADSLELPKVEKKDIKVILNDDQAAFSEAIKGHDLECLFVVAMHTGARISEILGMTWKNTNLDTGEIKINAQLQRPRSDGMERTLVSTKTGNHRTVVVPEFVVDALIAEKRAQLSNRLKAGKMWRNDLGLVFTRADGSPIPHTTVSNAFKRIVTEIGRPDLSFHALRHTYATEEIASGTDPKTVANTLGHTTVHMTMDVYATAVSSTKKSSAERRQRQYVEKNSASG